MDPYYTKYIKYNKKYKKYKKLQNLNNINMMGGSSVKENEQTYIHNEEDEQTYIDNVKKGINELEKLLNKKRDLDTKEQNIFIKIEELSKLIITLQIKKKEAENEIEELYREKEIKKKQIKQPFFLKSKKQKNDEETFRKDIKMIEEKILSKNKNKQVIIDQNISDCQEKIEYIVDLTNSIDELSNYGNYLKSSSILIEHLNKNDLDNYTITLKKIIKQSFTENMKQLNIDIIDQTRNIFLTLDVYTGNINNLTDWNMKRSKIYNSLQLQEIKRLQNDPFNITFPITKHETEFERKKNLRKIQIYTISLPPTFPDDIIIKGDYLDDYYEIP
jgi:hypothetical protein